MTTVAFVILEIAFLRSDFHFTVVADALLDDDAAWYYRARRGVVLAGGLAAAVAVAALAVVARSCCFLLRGRLRDVAPYATAVLLGLGAFFAGLLLFTASPFDARRAGADRGRRAQPAAAPPEHDDPPRRCSTRGTRCSAVPFAFAIGALIVRRVDAEWIRATRLLRARRLAASSASAILLGARWSYAELGWGGYWAWDPVENASLLPWLTGTAFLHSVMIQEKRGMLKVWNAR